jgi:hypothetical protein
LAKVPSKGETSFSKLLTLAKAAGKAVGSVGKVPLPGEEEDTSLKDLVTMLVVGTGTGTAELGGGLVGAVKEPFKGDERYPNPIEAWGKGFSRGVEGVQGGERFQRARSAENLARTRLGLPPAEEMWVEEMLLGMALPPVGPRRPPHIPSVRGGENLIESAGELAKEIIKRRASRHRLEGPMQGMTSGQQLYSTLTSPRVVDPSRMSQNLEPLDRLGMLDRIVEDVRDAQTVEDLESGAIEGIAPITRQQVADIFPQERGVIEPGHLRDAAGEPQRRARMAADEARQTLELAIREGNRLGMRTPEGREAAGLGYQDLVSRILYQQVDPAYLDPDTLDRLRYFVLNPAEMNYHGLNPENAQRFVDNYLTPRPGRYGLEENILPPSVRGEYEGAQDIVNDLMDYAIDPADLTNEELQEARRWLQSREGSLTNVGHQIRETVEDELSRRSRGAVGPTPIPGRRSELQGELPSLFRDRDITDVNDVTDDELFDLLDRWEDMAGMDQDLVRAESQSRGLIDENWEPRRRSAEVPPTDIGDLTNSQIRQELNRIGEAIDEEMAAQGYPNPDSAARQQELDWELSMRSDMRSVSDQELTDILRGIHERPNEFEYSAAEIQFFRREARRRSLEVPQAGESWNASMGRSYYRQLQNEEEYNRLIDYINNPDTPTEGLENVHTGIVEYMDGNPDLTSRGTARADQFLDRLERIIDARPAGREPPPGRGVGTQAFLDGSLLRELRNNRSAGFEYNDLSNDGLMDYHDRITTLLEGPHAPEAGNTERSDIDDLLREIKAYLRERGIL